MSTTYAGGRRMLDADSHVMELADFLDGFIDPEQRDRLRRRGMEALKPVLDKAVRGVEERRADEAKAVAPRRGSCRTRGGRRSAPST
jgi:hypothetical protein